MEKWNKADVLNEISEEKWLFFCKSNKLYLWSDIGPYLIKNYSGSMLDDVGGNLPGYRFNFSSEGEYVKFKLTWY